MSFERSFNVGFFVFLSCFVPNAILFAADSAIHSIRETEKSLVSIQGVNSAVARSGPKGVLDKATGALLVFRKIRPVGYVRKGSGVIIDPKGIIVTTAHTVRQAGGISVTLFDGTRARVLSVDIVPDTDIAFIAVTPPFDLTAVPFADSDKVAKGTNVYTIGHSRWLKGTMLGGTVSGIRQGLVGGAKHTTLIRVTFPMQHGDSGCPVFDGRGYFLGMVNAGSRRATFALASNVIGIAYRDYLENVYKMGQGTSAGQAHEPVDKGPGAVGNSHELS